MPPVSTIREIINLLDQSWVEKIDPRELYQAHAYQLDVTFTQADIPADITGAAFSIVIQNANGGSVKTFAGTITDAEKGKGSVSLPAAQMDFSGSNYRALIVFNNSVCARFDLVVKPFGTPAPEPGTVIDWSAYSGYAETAEHGPVIPDGETTEVKETTAKGQIKIGVIDDVYAELEGGNTFDASPQIMGILQALASTGLLVRDSAGNLILTIGNQTPGARQFRVEGVIETSGGSVIGQNISCPANITAGGVGTSARLRLTTFTGAAVIDAFQDGEHLYIRPRVSGHTLGGDLYLCDQGGNVILQQLTASLPLALDANKRAVTLPASDFRTLIAAAPLTPTVNAQTGTTYTLALADAGAVVTATNADAVTVTVPTNAAIAYPVGTVINVLQGGAGAVTVEGDTGVTVNGVSGGSVTTTPQYQGVSLLKVGADEWIVSGAADIPLASTTVFGLAKLPGINALTLDGNKSITPAVNGEIHNVTLEGNHTLTLNDPADTTKAVKVVVRTIQDATGGHNTTWGGNVGSPGGVAIPAQTSTANAVDIFEWLWTGARYELVGAIFDVEAL